MNAKHILRPLCLVLITCGLFSCSKMDSTYAPFVKDGLVIYTPKIDSLKALAGRDRIMLTGRIAERVDHFVIYWNNGRDSLMQTAPFDKVINDTLYVPIANLMEKTYFFDMVTYDQYGHVSVPATTKGRAYGDQYQALLENRSIASLTQSPDAKDIIIDWTAARTGEVGVQVRYADSNGDSLTVWVADSSSQTVLPSYQHGSTLSYRSMYLPETTAVDTFFCAYRQIDLPE